jgi:Leucine-rich repeat (LRR) protein
VSDVSLPSLNASLLQTMPGLHKLNLSGSGVSSVSEGALQALPQLTLLDVRGCPLTQIPGRLLHGLSELRTVHADNFKLCCPQLLPDSFNPSGCHAK